MPSRIIARYGFLLLFASVFVERNHATKLSRRLCLRAGTPLAFFAWPDSFKLNSKSPHPDPGELKKDESRLRGGNSDSKASCEVLGPTTKPLSYSIKSQQSFHTDQQKDSLAAGSGFPLSELISMLQAQESILMQQASRCRVAAQRLVFIQQLLFTKVYTKGGEPQNRADLEDEVVRWKAATYDMHRQLNKCLGSAGVAFADLLGESKLILPPAPKSSELQGVLDSEVTPEHHSEEDEAVKAAKKIKKTIAVDGPTTRVTDKKRLYETQMIFAPEVEAKYRVATWHGLAVYGAIPDASQTVFEYPGDTELHLVWDIDQSKLVGEGTNDVELVIKCVLWWKEELKHDTGFIPSAVPEPVKKEFRDYCSSFELQDAFRNVMQLLVRPKIRDFVNQHPQAKWWTFTNKDREVDGQIVRDVSDEDGLVGKFQANVHEVSGKQVVDANKYALQVLDECANEHAGMKAEERPIIGVRGQRKDLGRVAKLIQSKRVKDGVSASKPVTIILLDDRKQDAYGNCQANDQRILCHITPYNAITPEQGVELISAMEKILPVETLLKFYKAFRAADPSHALVQCVEIMSDDQSMLLKRHGSGESTRFEYRPKVSASLKLPPLPVFKRVVCRGT